jgi:hypothetical protein
MSDHITNDEYKEGFDAGYDYAIHEMELYIKRCEYEPRISSPIKNLLKYLKKDVDGK